MKITKLLYFKTRQEWRKWLEKNYNKEPDIWHLYYKKDTGKPRLPYNDAVEEALCFGWIDSTIKGIDETSFAQRFSPRKSNSPYSQPNVERMERLIAQGRVLDEVIQKYKAQNIKTDGKFEIAEDILKTIKENKDAWLNFQRFSDGYKRIRIAYIEGARKRPEEFRKRLNYLINMSAKNKQFGYGGVEKYYKP